MSKQRRAWSSPQQWPDPGPSRDFPVTLNFAMKRTPGLILILMIAVPFAATYIALRFEKHEIRRAVKMQIIAGMEEDDLTLIRIHTTTDAVALEWVKPHEFRYEGQMYDIVKQEVHGDSTFYWCWRDMEEMAVERELERLLSFYDRQNDDIPETGLQIQQVLKNWYFVPDPGPGDDLLEGLTTCFEDGARGHLLPGTQPPNPPPRMV